ncbi:hypothetical protein C0J52_09520 [Blattella germanica]|nr:hypothetical protein C0J52_09520 [Blattella germanica]
MFNVVQWNPANPNQLGPRSVRIGQNSDYRGLFVINKLGLYIESRSYSLGGFNVQCYFWTGMPGLKASTRRSEVYSQNHRPMQKNIRNTFVKYLI